MVITLVAHVAVTPGGSPVAAPIPVATVVVLVMVGKIVLTHTLGLLAALTVGVFTLMLIALVTGLQLPLLTVTVCVPAADTVKETPLVMACGPDHVYPVPPFPVNTTAPPIQAPTVSAITILRIVLCSVTNKLPDGSVANPIGPRNLAAAPTPLAKP